jgi:Flp pilus assembly pilin Flp
MGTGSAFDWFLQRLHAGFVRDDRGATASEYALLLAFIMVVIVVAVKGFGPILADLFQRYPDLSSS